MSSRGLKCPHCGSQQTDVTHVGVSEKGAHVRRLRQCQGCQRTFATYEMAAGNKAHADQKQLGRIVDQIVELAGQAQLVTRGAHIEGKDAGKR